MPSLHELMVLCGDQLPDDTQLMRGEAIIAGKHYRFKPEFTGSIFPLYMYVSRFVTVKTVKEKTVRN
jgi:hypothetical protein